MPRKNKLEEPIKRPAIVIIENRFTKRAVLITYGSGWSVTPVSSIFLLSVCKTFQLTGDNDNKKSDVWKCATNIKRFRKSYFNKHAQIR